MNSPYPATPAARDAWILTRRPERNAVSHDAAYGAFIELEPDAAGVVRTVATVLLSSRECPYRCLMCDLWKNTTGASVASGAIVRQLSTALGTPPLAGAGATTIKLYNSGNFFDSGAVPPGDYGAIAALLAPFDNVIVECHPALAGPQATRMAAMMRGSLEVAMGLEVADDALLDALNKRLTLDMYARTAAFLGAVGIAHRAFVLVQPPFVRPEAAAELAVRTASFAFGHGASAVSLIPVRPGNGALEELMSSGDFSKPTLATLERAHEAALALGRGRVFADTWDLGQFSACAYCFARRAGRMHEMNVTQRALPRVVCAACGNNP